MYKSLSVKIRLSGFIFLLLALLLSTGIFGLIGMKNSNTSLSEVYNYQVIPLNELRNLDNDMRIGIVSAVDKVLFGQMSWDECLVIVKRLNTQINDRWKNLHGISSSKSSKEISWLSQAEQLISNSDTVLESLVVILQTKNKERLDSFSDNELAVLAHDYSAQINKLINLKLAGVEDEFHNSQLRYTQAKKSFLLELAAAIIVSIILSLILMQSINQPLAQIIKAMNFLMKGDLSKKIKYDKEDEFGILISGFNQMTTYLADLISEIEKSGIQVTSSITEIASSIKEQETTVNEQAATSNEIAASITEIAATAENLDTTMGKVTDMAQETAEAASQGHNRLTSINTIMKTMEDSTGSIVAKLSILSEKASKIVGVTKTINKIADQTNLLSLNAAIEAEKAGEYGTGFSVVSSEIRRLADQTAVAAFDIEQMVNEVQNAVGSGVMSIEKFADDVRKSSSEIQISSSKISDVIVQVQALRPPIETVNEGISAQSLGARQISEAVEQLNEAAQQTAESVGQTSSAIFQLNKASLILRDSVSRFRLKDSDNEASYSPDEE